MRCKMMALCALSVIVPAVLQAADHVDLIIPKTIQEVPAYCAQFLKTVVTQPFDNNLESHLLSHVDDWEDNITLFGRWSDSLLTDVLLRAANSVYQKRPRNRDEAHFHVDHVFFKMSDQELSALYDTLIEKIKDGWKRASLEECPWIRFKDPSKLYLFLNDQKHAVENDEFIRFLIARLKMAGEADCRTINGTRACLWIKKESIHAFQETYNVDCATE